ncbi:hypothetical protein SO694_00008047 [Aureococcus anophagefferens]|uniref:PARP catalytic domain-containing protein n=1 Tax=Aureococcus anophagefferens TaxID=44056 RepID=A0ABR1GDL2_AURAN
MSLHDVISLWWPLAVFMLLYLQYKHKKERDAKVALARRLDSLQREHAMVTASNAARGTELEETRRQRDAVDEALGRARAERDAFEADARELGAAAALSRAAFDAARRQGRREVAEPALSKILVAARGGADGHYRVVAAAAAAGVASGFYATATRRLEAARLRAPAARGRADLAYLELDAGPKDGTCRPRWEPFEPAAAQRRLAADSHAFLDAAALVRTSLAPALDGVRGVARGVARMIAGAPRGVSRKIASTEPPVVILAVHAVRNAERGAFFDLAVDQFAARGEPPNVTKAFHGTTLGACAPIAGHGFVLRDRNASVYGVGAYFSPAGRRRGLMALDPTYASPDAAGRQHLLLCSVARGESERLKAGGARGHAQMQPSPPEDGVRFTTGVDAETIDDASRLVVWGGILNTHVRVDAVVTLRCLDRDELTGDLRDGVDPLESDPAEETTPEKARDELSSTC